MIQDLNWMDEKTKSEALRKAKTMRANIAYPDWLMNNTAEALYYASKSRFFFSLKPTDWRIVPENNIKLSAVFQKVTYAKRFHLNDTIWELK